jgi:hypothetical protein
MPVVKEFNMRFDVPMVFFSVPECQLTENDCALQILHKARPTSSVSSGTGLVSATSDSDYKFTSASISCARNMVSIYHYS